MSAPHRAREARRAEVARLCLRRQSQAEIARALRCSPAQVSRDVAFLRRDWRAAADRNYKDIRAEVLAEIGELKQAFWEAAQKSLEQRERSLARRREGSGQMTETSLRREPGRLNPAFLNGVARCLDREIRLLGLNHEDRTEESRPPEPRIPLSETEYDEEIRRLLSGIGQGGHSRIQPGDILPPGFPMPPV